MHRSLLVLLVLVTAAPALAGYGCPRFWAGMHGVKTLSLQSGRVAFERANEVSPEQPSCSETVPPIALSLNELAALRPELLEDGPLDPQYVEIEQSPHACTRVGTHAYFGLSFYQGEGITGAGGIGRLDLASKQVELRRPVPLTAASVRKILPVERSLWIATENRIEGTRRPGIGLARYDWEANRLHTFWGSAEGPCGVWVNDLLVHEGELWVATELGISRHALDHKTWRHFAPRDDEPGSLREASCREIAQEAADRLPADNDVEQDGACDLDGMTPRGVFRALLEKYRPAIAEQVRWNGSKQ